MVIRGTHHKTKKEARSYQKQEKATSANDAILVVRGQWSTVVQIQTRAKERQCRPVGHGIAAQNFNRFFFLGSQWVGTLRKSDNN
jgi:hypothetical protein